MANTPALGEFERDRKRYIELLRMIIAEVEQFDGFVHEPRAFRVHGLTQEILDLELWYTLGFPCPPLQFVQAGAPNHPVKTILFQVPRGVGIGLISLIDEERGDHLALPAGLLEAARHGWPALVANLGRCVREAEALVDQPSPAIHHPRVLEGNQRVNDDPLCRKLASLYSAVSTQTDALASHSKAESVFRERALLALVAHALPGRGPIFDLRFAATGNETSSLLIGYRPDGSEPIAVPIGTQVSVRSRRAHSTRILALIEEWIRLRAEALDAVIPAASTADTSLAKPASGSVPAPSIESVQEAVRSVRQMSEDRRLTIQDVLDLLRVEGVSATAAARSTKYVARKVPYERHQLPPRASSPAKNSRGQFVSVTTWSRDEVLAAMKGWGDRLGAPLTSPFGENQ